MKVSTRDKASHYQMPLQKLMIVFILFIITTVMALNGWAVFNSHQQLIDSTERNAKNLSLSLARHATPKTRFYKSIYCYKTYKSVSIRMVYHPRK